MITSLLDNAMSEKYVSKGSLLLLLRRTSRYLVPSFLSTNPEPQIVRPTDFLDGMRGFACFIVFLWHAVYPLYPNAMVGFWSNNGLKSDYYVTQLPIIRLFYSGPVMVLIFFVLSGFSITLKPLKLARRGASELLYDNLVSAAFRRAGRLYFPCVALILLVSLQSYFGCFQWPESVSRDWPIMRKQVPEGLRLKSGRFAHLCQSLWQWSDPLNPTTRPRWMPYATQLWTIPIELRCSFITWAVVLGLSKTRPLYRTMIMVSSSLYLFARKQSSPALFIAGATMAELYLRLEESTKSVGETTRQKVKNGLIFFIALYFLSYPRKNGSTALGWPLIYKIGSLFVDIEIEGGYPNDFFYHIGAVLLVYSVSQSKDLLQPIFSSPLAKYLGKISYALYCVHIPILNWVGFRIIIFWWTSALGNNLGFIVAFAIIFVVTFWAADLFSRAVDEPCVKVAKWLENKCLDTSCT